MPKFLPYTVKPAAPVVGRSAGKLTAAAASAMSNSLRDPSASLLTEYDVNWGGSYEKHGKHPAPCVYSLTDGDPAPPLRTTTATLRPCPAGAVHSYFDICVASS